MRMVASVKRKADPRSKLLGRCCSSLYTEEGQRAFAGAVVQHVEAPSEQGAETPSSGLFMNRMNKSNHENISQIMIMISQLLD